MTRPISSRADLQQWVRDLTTPLLPCFSPGCAHVEVGPERGHFGARAGWLEGFARPLWGLAPLAAGGGEFDHWTLWQAGLANGVDPDHPEFWGVTGDFDQRSVEQGVLGFALAEAPEVFWDPLEPTAKENLVRWMKHIDEVQVVNSNWRFFRVMVHLGLRRVGAEWSPSQVAADLAAIDGMYLGKGWYADGSPGGTENDGRRGDYYIPMAFHYFGLIYARQIGAEGQRFVDRAIEFAQDFLYYFASDGAALPFGRSLTYRFAQGAFWGALAYAGVEALQWDVLKGLYMRHMRWWSGQNMVTPSGILTIGYSNPQPQMAESYNSAQSPYWGLKAFLPLSLPESHPFWQAEEAEMPPRKSVHAIPFAGMVACVDARSGDVTTLNAGQAVLNWPRHAAAKYSKFAYSTRYGFTVPIGASDASEGGLDSTLAIRPVSEAKPPLPFRPRGFVPETEVSKESVYSRWSPWPGIHVETWLTPIESGHVRLHRIESDVAFETLEAGFAYGIDEPSSAPVAATLADLSGGRTYRAVSLGPGSCLTSSLANLPHLVGQHPAGETWLATWVSHGVGVDPIPEVDLMSLPLVGKWPPSPNGDSLASFLSSSHRNP